MGDHGFVGRMANHGRVNGRFPMVSFCRCGLAFFRADLDLSDEALNEHLKEFENA